jgi:hypothetical protein
VIGQERVERTKVADAVEGDQVALVSADGTPTVGKLVDRQRVLSGRLTEITVEKPDGTRERHMLSRNAPIYLMPDLPDPTPVDDPAIDGQSLPEPEAVPDGPVAADQVDIGDRITVDDVTGRVTGKTDGGQVTVRSDDVAGPDDAPVEVRVDLVDQRAFLLARHNAELRTAIRSLVDDTNTDTDVDYRAGMLRDTVTRNGLLPIRRQFLQSSGQFGSKADVLAYLEAPETRLGLVDQAGVSDAAVEDVARYIRPGRDAAGRTDAAGLDAPITALLRGARADYYDRVLAGVRDWPDGDDQTAAGELLAAVVTSTPDDVPDRERYRTVVRAGMGLAEEVRPEVPSPDELLDETAGRALAEQIGLLRLALPEDTANLGHRSFRLQRFEDVTVEDLDAGRTPRISEVTVVGPDRADDDGPGEVALRHEAVLRAAGRLLNGRVEARTAEIAGADATPEVLRRARAQAALEVLSQVREMGWRDSGGALPLARLAQRDLTGAIRWAEQFYPTDWLRQARERTNGRLRVKAVERGFHGHTDSLLGGPKLTIALSRHPDPGLGGGQYGETAVHELAHHFELAVPGLVEAQRAFLWRRTSRGEVGSRQREAPVLIAGTTDEYGREDHFSHPYLGKEYPDGNAEVLSTAMQSVFGGASYADSDSDLREWLLGTLALVGTPAVVGDRQDVNRPAAAAPPAPDAGEAPDGVSSFDLPPVVTDEGGDPELRAANAARLQGATTRRLSREQRGRSFMQYGATTTTQDELEQVIANGLIEAVRTGRPVWLVPTNTGLAPEKSRGVARFSAVARLDPDGSVWKLTPAGTDRAQEARQSDAAVAAVLDRRLSTRRAGTTARPSAMEQLSTTDLIGQYELAISSNNRGGRVNRQRRIDYIAGLLAARSDAGDEAAQAWLDATRNSEGTGPAQAGPQLPADLSTLSDRELQLLMIDPAVMADGAAIGRVRAEYMRRAQELIQSRQGG